MALSTLQKIRSARGAVLALALSGVAIAGCATPPSNDPEAMAAFKEANDPYEPFNRAMFDVNMALDKAVLRPAAYVYREGMPDNAKDILKNFLDHLRTPVIFANDIFQGEFERAGITLVRFGINSGIGFFGATDIAGELGFRRHDEDFGQTLAVHGAGEGPYLMLPLFGPSNPRDALGLVVDFFLDPFGYVDNTAFGLGRTGGRAIDTRARRWDTIEELERTSLDYYATVRSLYRQRRADEIRNGAAGAVETAPTPTLGGGSAGRKSPEMSKAGQ